jgi:hypothetical protein
MKFRLLILTICLSPVLFFSCESSYIRLNDAGTFLKDTTDTVAIDTVHFSTEILSVIQSNCGPCHFAGTNPDFESADLYNNLINGNYLNLANPENSTFFTLPDPGHADDYLTAEQHVLIVKWIEQGALNN